MMKILFCFLSFAKSRFVRRISEPKYPFLLAKWVINPADRLITKVTASLQTDNFHPTVATLKKNISGSMEGDAIQNDITGANGTPPINNDVITGITPQEQNGLTAPMAVARKIAIKGFLLNAFRIYLDAPES